MERKELDLSLINMGKEFLSSVRLSPEPYTKNVAFLYIEKGATVDMLTAILKVVDRACAPGPWEEIVKAYTEMSLLCRNRAMEEDEVLLTLGAFDDRFKRYPADAVLTAMKLWPENHTFMPSWHEMRQEIERLCWSRTRVRDALKAAIKKRTP